MCRQVSPACEASGRGMPCGSVRARVRVQELVDVGLARVERERPEQACDGFDLGTVSLGRAEWYFVHVPLPCCCVGAPAAIHCRRLSRSLGERPRVGL